MTQYTPVVLFTYKRLAITKQVVEALLANNEASSTDLLIYSDGPKSVADEQQVNDVRNYVRGLKGFKSIEVICREKNLGLAQSFIQGITESLERFEQAIFLEDDNLVSNHFLSFMNRALNFYKDNDKVICVTGYSWPLKPMPDKPYFVRGAETWSMGTWRRGWSHFCSDGNKLLADVESNGLVKKFRSDGFGFYEMLQRQVRGEIDSWGVRWWTSAFVQDKYSLYPHRALCVSIGYGADSVHCKEYIPMFGVSEELSDQPVTDFPKEVRCDASILKRIRNMNGVTFTAKIKKMLKRLYEFN